ncbi:hypothetical protein BDF22DRAFT_732975 [Syncephalis plumigaleata]|nr:hypothetical protein BDF22DRAFT_732975 [Syncephalis plumigaleata]
MVSFRSLSFTAIVVLAILGSASATPMNPPPGSQSLTGGQGNSQLQVGQRGGLKRASSQELIRDQELVKNQRPTFELSPAVLEQILAQLEQELWGEDQEANLQKEILRRQKLAIQQRDVPELRQILVLTEQALSRTEQKIAQRQVIIEQLKQTPERLLSLQQQMLLYQMEQVLPQLQERYVLLQQRVAEQKHLIALHQRPRQ